MEWPLRPLPSRNGIGSGSLPGTEESNQAAIRERIETLRQRRAETRLQRRQPSPPRESRGFRSVPSQWLQSRRAVFLFLPDRNGSKHFARGELRPAYKGGNPLLRVSREGFDLSLRNGFKVVGRYSYFCPLLSKTAVTLSDCTR